MTKDVHEIRDILVQLLKEHQAVFEIKVDKFEQFEVWGTIPAMQGKKKVDGFYFASVIPKAKDVRLYFFPVYTHREKVGELPENLQKALKGKSCFHIKYMDNELESNLKTLIGKSVKVYQEDNLLAS